MERKMDVTSVNLGSETRDALAEYRDQQEYSSYNEAIRGLLETAEAYP